MEASYEPNISLIELILEEPTSIQPIARYRLHPKKGEKYTGKECIEGCLGMDLIRIPFRNVVDKKSSFNMPKKNPWKKYKEGNKNL